MGDLPQESLDTLSQSTAQHPFPILRCPHYMILGPVDRMTRPLACHAGLLTLPRLRREDFSSPPTGGRKSLGFVNGCGWSDIGCFLPLVQSKILFLSQALICPQPLCLRSPTGSKVRENRPCDG